MGILTNSRLPINTKFLIECDSFFWVEEMIFVLWLSRRTGSGFDLPLFEKACIIHKPANHRRERIYTSIRIWEGKQPPLIRGTQEWSMFTAISQVFYLKNLYLPTLTKGD